MSAYWTNEKLVERAKACIWHAIFSRDEDDPDEMTLEDRAKDWVYSLQDNDHDGAIFEELLEVGLTQADCYMTDQQEHFCLNCVLDLLAKGYRGE